MMLKEFRGKTLFLLSSIFLFSQMSLPEKIVPKTTYDYVVNLGKFSIANYSPNIPDEEMEKFLSLYEESYFTKKAITRRFRGLNGKRYYKKVFILQPRKSVNLSLDSKIYREYQWLSSRNSLLKDDVLLLYTDVLVAKGDYKKAESFLKSLSNSYVWDESVLRLANVAYRERDFSSLDYYLNEYLKLKEVENIYSPVYVVLDAINKVYKGNVSEGIDSVYSLVRNDFTKEYIFVDYFKEFFNFISSKKVAFSNDDIKKLKVICFEFLDNTKLFPDAFKIASKLSLGPEFLSEMLIELKLKGSKQYNKLANSYVGSFWRGVISNPFSIKKIDRYNLPTQAVIYKSLFAHYVSKGNFDLANEYLNKYADTTDLKYRLPKVVDRFIDKLLLSSRYDLLASLLDGRDGVDFSYVPSADRFFFFKGYGAENSGDTNKALNYYEKAIYVVPSGYYDFLATRRINTLASDSYLKSYRTSFISPDTPQNEKVNLAKILFSFDKDNRDTYKSLIFYSVKDENKFLLDIPYKIFDKIDTEEKKKISSIFRKLADDYSPITSKVLMTKLVYKGFSNIFSHILVIRNRLEVNLTRGIYNEGNNLTSNKFVDTFSKFLPFGLQEILYPIPYISEVLYSSERFGIDPNLIYSVMKQESFFQESAYSRAGAVGLMQVLYRTGKFVINLMDLNDIELDSRQDLFKADANIIIGSAYISMLMDYYGDLYHAISAYNGGPKVITKTQKKFRVPMSESIVFSEFLSFRETRSYIKRVIKYYNVYSSIYNFDVVKKDLEIDNVKNLDELKEKMKKFEKEFEGEVPNEYDEE